MAKFGVREICDVVLRAKNRMKVGNKIFYKNEPVIYFDTLKTSSLEGQATQVYAQGGKGNSRLISWEGERTVTFSMEDALISPEGFMILSGAGLVEGTEDKPIYQHVFETVDESDVDIAADGTVTIQLGEDSDMPYLPADKGDNFAYVMFKRDGDIVTEPYIPVHGEAMEKNENGRWVITVKSHECYDDSHANSTEEAPEYAARAIDGIKFDSVLVDYYVARTAAAKQIEITPDQFGGNFYLEASTLFRDEAGVDLPAEFIIPNCKIQSNFSFTMASSGDPSSFTFTLDAFPDYTRFDHSKKVLADLQIFDKSEIGFHRGATPNGTYDTGIAEESDKHEDLHADENMG